jgi:DNA polymerase III delta prime subunit
MEIYANTTRFCFACNQSSKIIDPIQSRCAILRYGKLSDEEVMKRLLEICEYEKVSQPGSCEFHQLRLTSSVQGGTQQGRSCGTGIHVRRRHEAGNQ